MLYPACHMAAQAVARLVCLMMCCQCAVAAAGTAPESSTVISNEFSLFDFIVKAAVSEQGDVQRVLLAPSTADSRGILLAVSQLLLYEHWARQQGQQGRPARAHRQEHQQGVVFEQQDGECVTYRQFKSLCNQVCSSLLLCALYYQLTSMTSWRFCSPYAATAHSNRVAPLLAVLHPWYGLCVGTCVASFLCSRIQAVTAPCLFVDH